MTTSTALCAIACPDHPHTCARSPQHYGHHRDAKQKGTETCSWPDPPTPRPAGPTVAETRGAAREALRGLTGGDPNPQWRAVFTDSEECDGIAPVCEDPDHEPTDGNTYDCCPEPVIEVWSVPLAAYLAVLLNADREQAKAASAESLSQLADCPRSRHDGLHCLHYQEGDGPCCDCGRANWCPNGEDA